VITNSSLTFVWPSLASFVLSQTMVNVPLVFSVTVLTSIHRFRPILTAK